MSIFDNKINKSVAEAVMKVMQQEELKGNQHKIDANKNGKVDAHDFKLLRGKKNLKEDDTGYQDRYAVKNGKAVKHNPLRGERDEPHHVWADSAEHAVRKHAAKTNAPVNESMSQDEYHADNDYPIKHHNMDSHSLKHLHDAHAHHEYVRDMEEPEDGGGDNGPAHKAVQHIEKHVEQKYGKHVAQHLQNSHLGNSNFKKMAAAAKVKKEEVELNEAFPTVADAKKRMAAGKTEHGSVTKTKTGLVHKRDYKDEDESDDMQKKAKGYGARQNYKRSTRVNEQLSFTEMLELYNEHGLKVLAPIETEEMDIDGTTIEVIDGDRINGYVETTVEEVTNDEFTKEFKDQQASFEGKKKQPKVAVGKTTGVKAMPEEYEQIDERAKWRTSSIAHNTGYRKDGPHGGIENTADTGKEDLLRNRQMLSRYGTPKKSEVKSLKKDIKKNIAQMKKEEYELDERSLTSDEKSEMEKNVKGMKKKLSGFKDRYGDDAKSVMYATATQMAKKD